MRSADSELRQIETRLVRVVTPPSIVGGLLIHVTILLWAWIHHTAFWPLLVVALATGFGNGPPIFWLADRIGRQRSEAVRAAMNVVSVYLLGHLTHWALPVWAFLTFFALPFDGFVDRWAKPRLALQVAAVDVIGLLDGGSPWLAAVFSLLAVLAYMLAEVRSGVIQDLYLETKSQRDALDVAHRELTARTEELHATHRKMNELARQAGMAEVATGILHNVGNTLNSVNVSAGMVAERVRQTRLEGLAKVNQLLQGHSDHLGTFLSEDPKGRQLPRYLAAVTENLEREQRENLGELEHLVKKVDHIKAIVALQQDHSRTSGVVCEVSLENVIDDALQLHADALQRSDITVLREGDVGVRIASDPHRIMQVLVNLLGNARHAVESGGRPDKRIAVRVSLTGAGRVRLSVQDNGVGISPEVMPRIFAQGFTTKKSGHGFGLHMSALAARSLQGELTVESEGPGKGATFVLELPLVRALGRAPEHPMDLAS